MVVWLTAYPITRVYSMVVPGGYACKSESRSRRRNLDTSQKYLNIVGEYMLFLLSLLPTPEPKNMERIADKGQKRLYAD